MNPSIVGLNIFSFEMRDTTKKLVYDLPLSSIRNLRFVCKAGNQLLQEEEIWKNLLERDFFIKSTEMSFYKAYQEEYNKALDICLLGAKIKIKDPHPEDIPTKKNLLKGKGITQIELKNQNILSLSPFLSCLAIKTISLFKTEIEKIPLVIFSLPLEHLMIKESKVKEIPLEIKKIASTLTFLDLSHNEITSIENLITCHKITTLDLSFNKIRNIPSLIGLSNLNKLYLQNNAVEEFSPEISHSLKELYFHKNPFKNIGCFKNISLTYLSIGETDLPKNILKSTKKSFSF